MRLQTLIFAVLISLGILTPASGQALLGHSGNGAFGTFTIPSSGSLNMTGAGRIVACTSAANSGALGVFADSLNNTYTAQLTKTNNHATVLYTSQINPTVSSTMTFTNTGGVVASTMVAGFSGIGPTDGTVVGYDNGGGSSNTTIQPGSKTPSQNNNVFVTCAGTDSSNSMTIGGIFSITNQIDLIGGTNYGTAMAWGTENNTTAQNPTWTQTGGGTRLTAIQISLGPSVAGPTISSIAHTNLSNLGTVFTWTTSGGATGKADSQVLCAADGGGAGPYNVYTTQVSDPVQASVSDAWGVTSHRLGVNLKANYSGHCVVQSCNQGGGCTQSADQTVTTGAAPTVISFGIGAISPRYNLTQGYVDATHKGFSGDIAFQTVGADGNWYQFNNDGRGKTVPSNLYCCVGHDLISKWTGQLGPRSMLLGQDASTPSSFIMNWFGGGDTTVGNPILTGTCSSNVASVTFADWGYKVPAGTPIYVAGATPSSYNVTGATVASSPAPTNTSLSYTATCGSTGWTSGGTIDPWNDGNHNTVIGADSVNGLQCLFTSRANGAHYMHRVCTTDYWAHSFIDANVVNPTAGSQTVVPYIDMPLPGQACLIGVCASQTPVYMLQVFPCKDYGGANQNTFTCTWLAGDENYIYYTGPVATGYGGGYVLLREPYADHARMNGIDGIGGTAIQEYTGSAICDDSGLLASNWTNTITRTHALNSGLATMGNTPIMTTLPDFNDFLLFNWTSVNMIDASQSSGGTIYSMCGRPWGIATPVKSLDRDETDISFFGTFGFPVPGTYNTVTSSPLRATLDFRQSGDYLNQTTDSTTNEYGSNWYQATLAPIWTGTRGADGVRFSFNAGLKDSFQSQGLDLFYDFSDISGTYTIADSSPNDPLGTYTSTLPNMMPTLLDRYGLYAPGFLGTCGTPGNVLHPCTQGGTPFTGSYTPYGFFISTPYKTPVATDDFTLAVVFAHQDTSNAGPPSGECVVGRVNLSICRNGTTANSWIVKVGSTSSGNLSITCDGGSSHFCGVIVNRVSGVAKVYKTDGLGPSTATPTVLATISDATTLGSDALGVGALPYTAGTISTSGTAVTGSGTSFTASMVGGSLVTTSPAVAYAISAVADGTHLTLASSAGTQTSVTYTIGNKPFQGLIQQLAMYSFATGTGMSDNQLVMLANAMRARAKQRGITLP